jgi:DNA mismatch endonuclease (patch repair protein)
MQANKGSGTKPELILAKVLRKRIIDSKLPGSPDFTYPKSKVAVFVNGCFWHRCPIHGRSLPKTNIEFWRRKFERNMERDRLNRAELESMGWKVIEVWEHDVKENPRDVARRIRNLAASESL